MARKSRPVSPGNGPFLVNQLKVEDAVHLLRNEGGPISTGRLVFRLVTVLAVASFTARAILVGNASAWHLFLPIVGEYLVLVISLPIINLVIHDVTLRQDCRRSGWWLLAILAGAATWITIVSSRTGRPWWDVPLGEGRRLLDWIVDHEMHWAILGASAAMALSLPGRVATFRQHGPPFVPIGMGCAMRVVVVVFGCFLVPSLVGHADRVTWAIWGVLLLSELGALWLHWDVQTRLKKRGIEG